MNKFTYDIKIPLQILAVLNENKQKIIHVYASETLYKESDIELLWTDLETFLNHFNEAFDMKQEVWNLETKLYKNFAKESSYIRQKHGKVLICLPYNAIIPLLPIFITSFCVFGNSIILSPSRKTLKTAKLILCLLNGLFQKNHFEVNLFENGGQEAISKFVLTQKVDLLFFQGSSRNRDEIYAKSINAGVEVIYEGEGNQITIVDSIIGKDIATTVKTISKYQSFCNGKLCTTPKILFINSNIYQDFCYTENDLNENTIILKYNNINEVIDYVKSNYDFGLQISIFSAQPNRIVRIISDNLNVARITVNMNPTFQNSLLPWGGYKKSGYSRVCDFFEKATKQIIIEFENIN